MKYLTIIIAMAFLVSCDKENKCFDTPGKETSLIVPLKADFTTLEVYDDLNIVLIHDTVNFIEITGGKNLINNILISDDETKVSFKNNNKCLFMSNKDDINIGVHYIQLMALGLYGYGDIATINSIPENLTVYGDDCYSTISLDVDNDSTYISLSGAPQLTLRGQSDYLYAYTVGKGNFFLQEAQTHFCHGHNRGIGDLHIHADQNYIVELRSRGDIYIYDTTNTDRFIVWEGEGKIYYP